MTEETKALSLEINGIMTGSGLSVATAESCTGGNIAAALTAVPGSSDYVRGGVVVYTEETKQKFLGVKKETLDQYTVYSEQVVREMVIGCCRMFQSTYAVTVSGVAGPGGGIPVAPVGTIWIAAGNAEKMITRKLTEDRGRELNIQSATQEGLKMLLELLKS